MTEQLSHSQELDILGQALEVYLEDADGGSPENEVVEIVDSWMPIYRGDILEQWVEAGCPEPEEELSEIKDAVSIYDLMTRALFDVAHSFLYGFISEAETHHEAATVINAELTLTQSERINRIMAR